MVEHDQRDLRPGSQVTIGEGDPANQNRLVRRVDK
jgi:hypothetical protein